MSREGMLYIHGFILICCIYHKSAQSLIHLQTEAKNVFFFFFF